eukprot:GHVN01033618.1.p1 GENE.GHVN01033618.1~~GHVN01033618.1.p1  ORF type:complete len:147 (+),score=22.73 GHVN01033618.1:221-661(+)
MPPKAFKPAKAAKPKRAIHKKREAEEVPVAVDDNNDDMDYRELVALLKKNYFKSTPQKVIILDIFLVFCLFIAAVLMAYVRAAGSFPFNSFLSALASSIGTFTLGLALRLQLMKPDKFNNVTPERAFADFLLCNLMLHVAVVTFLG